MTDAGPKGRVENPGNVLLLGLLTCLTYCFYWMWIRTKEMNDYLGRRQVNPLFVIPGCLCPPLCIYACWLMARGLPEAQKKAGIENARDEFQLHFLTLFLAPPLGQYLIQQRLNEIWRK